MPSFQCDESAGRNAYGLVAANPRGQTLDAVSHDACWVPRLLLAGYDGHGHAGEDAILAGLLSALTAAIGDLRVTVVSGDPAATRTRYGVDSVGDTDIAALVHAVEESDAVALGTGGLLHDDWDVDDDVFLTRRHGGLLAHVIYPALARLLGKPAVLGAVGVGPLVTERGRELTRIITELAPVGTARDPASLRLLGELSGTALIEEGERPPDATAGIRLAADPAFLLPIAPRPVVDRVLAEAGVGPDELLLGVALRPWRFGPAIDGWEDEVAAALASHVAAYPRRVLCLPFHAAPGHPGADDASVHAGVAARLSGRCEIVHLAAPADGFDPSLLAGLIGRCERLLAMRFHAVVFALRTGVPLVALADDSKVMELLAAAGLGPLALPTSAWRRQRIADALTAAPALALTSPIQPFVLAQRELAQRTVEAIRAVLAGTHPTRSRATKFLDRTLIAKSLRVDRLEDLVTTTTTRAETLLAEAADLRARIDALESTLVVRLGHRLWELMRRVAPEGTRRRRLYDRVRGRMDSDETAAGPGIDVLTVANDATDGRQPPDPVAELSAFARALADRRVDTVVAILATTQMIDSEGQRPTRLALEFAARAIPVVFGYWRWSPTEWVPQHDLDRGIVHVPVDVLNDRPELLAEAFATVPQRLLFLEWPHPGFVEVHAAVQAAGWITVFDVLDDWEEFHRVGQAVWYDPAVERHLLGAADAVFAINPALAARIRNLGRPDVGISPNGLKPGVERIREARALERGEITVGYFGYLTSAWFDWELVAETARRRPTWRIYLIGYGDDPPSPPPANVILLGRQPHAELAAYAANWDVAMIPFRPERLAAGADPIKTYEYLAMGLPVVATGVPPPSGGEAYVTIAYGVHAFIDAVQHAARQHDTAAVAARRAFANGATWRQRLDDLLAALARGDQRVAIKRQLFRDPA